MIAYRHSLQDELFRNNGLVCRFLPKRRKMLKHLDQYILRAMEMCSHYLFTMASPNRRSQDYGCRAVNTTSSRVNDIRPLQIKVQRSLNHAGRRYSASQKYSSDKMRILSRTSLDGRCSRLTQERNLSCAVALASPRPGGKWCWQICICTCRKVIK